MAAARISAFLGAVLVVATATVVAAAPPRVLRVRGDRAYPPFEYLDEHGEPAGYNIDLVRAVARTMQLDVRIDLGPWVEVRDQLEAGEIDMLAGMYQTDAREGAVDFSVPHLIVSYAVFVPAGSPIHDLTDARGAVIAVQESDLGHDYVVEHALASRLVLCPDLEGALRAVAAGVADCAVLSRLQGLRLIEQLGLSSLRPVGGSAVQHRYGFAVRQGDAELLARLNEGLSIIKSSGEYDRIHESWFGAYEQESTTVLDALRYVAWILAPLSATAAVALIWSWSLRRQVARRTAELAAELEFESLVADLSTHFASCTAASVAGEIAHALASVVRTLQVDAGLVYAVTADGRPWRRLGAVCDGRELSPDESSDPSPWLREIVRGQRDAVHDDAGSVCPEARRLGLRSALALPLQAGEATVAALVLGSREDRRSWTAERVQRARLIGEAIASVIERARAEEENRALAARLAESQKMEAVGTLAGGIAHDFNNILAAIMGWVELARDALTPDSVADQDLRRVQTASRRGAELVQQILTFSRERPEPRRPVDVCPVVLEAADLLRASLPAGVEVVTDLAPSETCILASPGQLHQVVMNLGTNAGHALRERGGTLAFAVRRLRVAADEPAPRDDLAPGDYVVLDVVDTGDGMEEDVARRCFEPFFTTRAAGQGTGLGLSMVHGIVRNLGGRVSVETKRGQGTRVTVVLPAVNEPAALPVSSST